MLYLIPSRVVVIFNFMKTLKELETHFSTEDNCMAYLVGLRWRDGVTCPRCDNANVYKLAKPWKWQCKVCNKNGYHFSPLSGTIFENTNVPLVTWFRVIFMMTQSKKGMSVLQVQRMIGKQQEKKGNKGAGPGSYRAAWYMCHRIRAAMKNETFMQLTGEVEVDQTYVGGKAKNRHGGRGGNGRGTAGKVAVIGAISRKRNVVAQVIEKTDTETLQGFVQETVSDKVSLVATDEHSGYRNLTKEGYPHESVAHGQGEYVRGNVHTANIDGFWSLIKRGIIGSFHHVSTKYLPLYVDEFAFRHNNRKNPGIFGEIVAGY